MLCLPTVAHPIKIMDQLVPSPAPVDINSAAPRLLGAELGESGVTM